MSIQDLHGRDLLSLADLDSTQLHELLAVATALKTGAEKPLCNKVLGLLFYKASTRTRVSFSVAMYQLGGQVIDLNPSVTQVGRGEPIIDTARVLDRYLDILAIRTFAQADLQTFADYAQIPVINALTDLAHPCQILADLLTMQEQFQTLKGLTLTYLGDGNNVVHSLLIGCALAGVNINVATPPDYAPSPAVVAQAQALALPDTTIKILTDPIAAVENTNVLYTDVWASMGQEDLAESRIPIFQPYQINDDLLSHADPDAIVLHCLPAHRGEEITESAMEGSHSRIWDQAENRMHAQKALMACLLGLVG
ncbi:ornithine carbamoyltransferase [Spirulina major CS-329]|jgi:ornithine carbamoyltransferase|uniref:ornithine carbamoyltransferase n=1 Tax=Spirulina TaxID=1154 RepID=UPI00232DEE05|nr:MULTISPECIES: ornithine carbamoyltransferase [Spirulina]MDB9495664.1 ornithine carbamoyltransferase [Spirulina subsalsa CS-330]MDB9501488.1 ornithine carbamoyltransferase [Spirulina major CS-329]